MKYIIVFILLSFQLKSDAQISRSDSKFKSYQLIKKFNDNFKLYGNDCTDTVVNKLAKKIFFENISNYSIDKSNDLKQREWHCSFFNDSELVSELYENLNKRIKTKGKLAFIIAMMSDQDEFLANVFIFDKKGFINYTKRYHQLEFQIDDPSGKSIIKHGYSFRKNINSFQLIISRKYFHFF